jgi:hypothetical protein
MAIKRVLPPKPAPFRGHPLPLPHFQIQFLTSLPYVMYHSLPHGLLFYPEDGSRKFL